MKIAILICRILLGFLMTFSGLNGLFHFLPNPPMAGDAGTVATLMVAHHWIAFVALCQVVAGAFLMVGRFVPLGLTILAAVLANILVYHLGFAPRAIGVGLVCTLVEAFLIYAYRASFRGIFDPLAQPTL